MRSAIPTLLFVSIVMVGCQSENETLPSKGEVQFSLDKKDHSGGRTEETAVPVAVLLSITDPQNSSVVQNKKLPLYAFGSGYVSESLQFSTGHYKLTQFMVLDAHDKVIYAAPIEGSPLAQYVDDPLPIDFSVTQNGSTLVVPQVLAITETDAPESFGYVAFGVEVVTGGLTFNFIGDNGIQYDSVRVIFSDGSKEINKKLALSKKDGKDIGIIFINSEELMPLSEYKSSWNIYISTYHSFFEGFYQSSFKETKVSASISLSPSITFVTLEGEQITTNTEDMKAESITYRHISDNGGHFKFIVNDTNPCDPYFKFQLFHTDVTYVYYDKYLYDAQFAMIDLKFREIWNPSIGEFTDTETFENSCAKVDNQEAFFSETLFYIKTSDGSGYAAIHYSNK